MSTGFNPDYLLGKASTEQRKQHLKGCFIRVNGLYYEHHDGIINHRFAPRPRKPFVRYLADFGEEWEFCSDDIPIYDAIVCKPKDQCSDREFNQITGMNYSIDYSRLNAAEKDQISTFIEHFTRILTSTADETQTLINFFGMKLLHPFNSVDRMEQYATFLGTTGVGKTEPLKRFWIKVLGRAQVLCTKFDRIGAKFNSQLMGKLIVMIDDGGGKMTERQAEKLKNLATDREIEIEVKFQDVSICPNNATMFITANQDNRIRPEADDRRANIFDVQDTRRGDHQYFTKLYHEIEHYHQLIVRWILSHMTVTDRLPLPEPTTAKNRCINSAKTELDDFFRDHLEAEGHDEMFSDDRSVKFRTRQMFNEYKDWCQVNYIDKPRFKQHELGQKLKRHCSEINGDKDNGRLYFPTRSKFNHFLNEIGAVNESDDVVTYQWTDPHNDEQLLNDQADPTVNKPKLTCSIKTSK